MHGSQVRAYLYKNDISGDSSNIVINPAADVHESTTFASNGAHESDPGLLGWDAEIDLFYDPSVGGIDALLTALVGSTGALLSVYDGLADGIGDHGVLLSNGILAKLAEPISITDLIKLKASLKPAGGTNSGRVGLDGRLLHVLAARSVTANGTSFDNGASSAFGGRANLHITAATGTGGVITIEDSADNASFATIATFTTAAAATAQTLEIAGTIRRYTRAVWTINGASSLTFVVGIARYTF